MDHPETLYTVNGMAVIFANQGKHDKALEWYGRALAGREKLLGVGHPDTLWTVYGMALVFGRQGQHDKALEWYSRALTGTEKAFIWGISISGHPPMQNIIRELADLYERMGKQEHSQRLRLRLTAMTQELEVTPIDPEISKKRAGCDLGRDGCEVSVSKRRKQRE